MMKISIFGFAVLAGWGAFSPAFADNIAWSSECQPSETVASNQICKVGATVMGAASNEMLFVIEMGKGSDQRDDFFRIISPLGSFLPNGIGLVVDEVEVGRVPIERCSKQGCFTVLRDPVGISKIQAALHGGHQLKIVYWIDPAQPLIVAMDIADYAAVWDDMESKL
jgi:invasion protein IalB